MQTHITWIGIGGMVVLAWAVEGRSAGTRGTAAAEIGVPGRANAFVSIAASGSFVGVAWAARTSDGATDAYVATSRDGGRAFAAPVRVNQVPGDVKVSGEQPPRIVLTPQQSGNPAMVVLWTARAASGTRLVSARSDDGGRSFGPAASVPGSDASGNRGWESAAVTASGDVVAVWLDHRDAAAGAHQHATAAQPSGSGPPAAPAPALDGAARAQLSQIFAARLNEPASARAIAPGVCYCCKTSIAAGPDGTVAAAWRHVYKGNIRDIALARSSDGGRTFAPPVRVSEDNWVIDGCPENGPAVVIDRSHAIHVVWATLVPGAGADGTPAMFYATSTDGRRFTPRQRIPTEGTAQHPQMAVGFDGTLTLAWDEFLKGARRIVVLRGTRDARNAVRFVRHSVSDEPGTYPAVVALSDAVIVAWTSGPTDKSVVRIDRHPADK